MKFEQDGTKYFNLLGKLIATLAQVVNKHWWEEKRNS